MFDRQKCRDVNAAVLAAVKPLEKQLGVEFHVGGGTFLDSDYKLKLEVREVDAKTGKAADPLVEDFKRLAPRYGLKAEDLGAEFVFMGKSMKVHGLRAKARRTPIICRDLVNGKLYRLDAHTVSTWLKHQREQALDIKKAAVAA